MEVQRVIEQIREHIGRNEMGTAIRLLRDLLALSPKLDVVIVQSARHHDLARRIQLGILDYNEAELAKNKLRSDVLDMLREMEGHLQNEAAALDDFEKIAQKIKTNRGAETSEILKGKTVGDLDEEEAGRFFERSRVLRLFREMGWNLAVLSIHERLLKLSLAENGHLYKGTFFSLGQANQIDSILHTAAESRFAVFKGTGRSHFLILEVVRGNIVQQYEKMVRLLRVHIPLRLDAFKKEEFYEIPEAAFDELTANAFIHRTYAPGTLSTIQVELYDDRLEIKSPGLFPGNLDFDNIERSLLVNPTIAAVFSLYGHIEKSGTGIERAKTALLEAGLRPPVLHQDKVLNHVKVTIFRPER